MSGPHHPPTPSRRITTALLLLTSLILPACPPVHPSSTKPDADSANGSRKVLLDFEQPSPPVEWLAATTRSAPAPDTAPATQPEALTRSSLRPNTGLWSLKVIPQLTGPGRIQHTFATPADLHDYDTFAAAILHTGAHQRSGEWTATLSLTDADGHSYTGDAYPVLSHWQSVPLDLNAAAEEGLDLSHIASAAVILHPSDQPPAPPPDEAASKPEPLEIQTDTWQAERVRRTYLSPLPANPRTKAFYAEQMGTTLRVGLADNYEILFHQRAGIQRPWLEIWRASPKRRVLGQPNSGLMLLTETLPDLHRDVPPSLPLGAPPTPLQRHNPITGWSGVWTWQVTWTSPLATLVELKQELGPYDRLGDPAVAVTWRFMIYQWGQTFVHAEWITNRNVAAPPRGPISWALALDSSILGWTVESGILAPTPTDAERLLHDIYPTIVLDNLGTTALPHQMQAGAPVAMLGKSTIGPTLADAWWWARTDTQKVFGTGLSSSAGNPTGSADCLLLVNAPSPLTQAASFGQYLLPPRITIRQGELDRTFPGDADNDGFVESYGFQAIRLANGRASFTINPQGRPIFSPAYLFTVPAVERQSLDLKNSRVLITVDGQPFADPPQFPDGSFLLQFPYILNKPVAVEAVLVKK